MGGRIVDLLSTPHLATEALLPWLLNDTLTSADLNYTIRVYQWVPARQSSLQ